MSSPSSTIFTKLNQLSDAAKAEVEDFIDFLIQKGTKEKKSPKSGFLKGTFKMAEDFDEPLEDFKEYM